MISGTRRFKTRLSGASFIASVGVAASTVVLIALGAGSAKTVADDMSHLEQRRQCHAFYEPSGITQLADGRIVVVDDEENQPIATLLLNEKLMVSVGRLNIDSLFTGSSKGVSDGSIDDLEALAVDDQGFVHAITSHSRKKSGKRSSTREQLLRFRVTENSLEQASARVDLRKAMTRVDKKLQAAAKVVDVKGGNGFNIEGLSFNRTRGELLIGLRSPVIDGKAVILVMKNPHASFGKAAAPDFAADPIYLALDEGGIRAMAYDSTLGGYLIISRQEKVGEQFKLWLWSGDSAHVPRRVHISDKFDLSNAEGITPIRHHDRNLIMIAFDNGPKSKHNKGCYALVPYDQLQVTDLSK